MLASYISLHPDQHGSQMENDHVLTRVTNPQLFTIHDLFLILIPIFGSAKNKEHIKAIYASVSCLIDQDTSHQDIRSGSVVGQEPMGIYEVEPLHVQHDTNMDIEHPSPRSCTWEEAESLLESQLQTTTEVSNSDSGIASLLKWSSNT